jgi:hypothetical protein
VDEGGARQGPWADALAMPGCCIPGIQYGVEEGAIDCCGYGGHQAPEAKIEGVAVGGTGWAPFGGGTDWVLEAGGISIGGGAEVLLDGGILQGRRAMAI